MATKQKSQSPFFVVSRIHNLNWGSDIPKASFNLVTLIGDGTLGGTEGKDWILKCHNGNWWIEGKSIKAKTPWTGRDGKLHEYDHINNTYPLDKGVLQQLTDMVRGMYREDGNYEALNNPTATVEQPATTTTTTESVQNGTTVQPVAQEQEVAVAK